MSGHRIAKEDSLKRASEEKSAFPPQLSSADWKRLHNSPFLVLFQTYSGTAMYFFLNFKTQDKTNYVKLIERCGGAIDPGYTRRKTLVLVDPDQNPAFEERPMFKMNYVVDCVSQGALLDPKDYLFNKIPRFVGVSFVELLYFGKSLEMLEGEVESEASDTSLRSVITTGTSEEEEEEESPPAERAKQDFFKALPRPTIIDKHSKLKYMPSEQKVILNYILSTKNSFQMVRGKTFWKLMEKKNLCPLRTFESLRNHFFRYLLPKIETFTYLDPKDMKKFIALKKESVVRNGPPNVNLLPRPVFSPPSSPSDSS